MISALFVRSNSIYKTLGVDCWDAERNALFWPGGNPAIFHPPCRGWGSFHGLSVATLEEKALAPWSIDQVRKWGGVVEHPRSSSLWSYCRLPTGRNLDLYGGFTLCINQHWFGHLAEKKTLLYIVGLRPADIPPYPLNLDAVTHIVATSSSQRVKKELSKSARECTPIALATWLIQVCEMIGQYKPRSPGLQGSSGDC